MPRNTETEVPVDSEYPNNHTIKIGHRYYQIHVTDMGRSNQRDSDARLEPHYGTLTIADDLNSERFVECLIHEVCHAVLNEWWTPDHDEALVNAFAKGLTTVFTDNPELVNHISHRLKRAAPQARYGLGDVVLHAMTAGAS